MCKLGLESLEELQESVCDLLLVVWHGSIFDRRLEKLTPDLSGMTCWHAFCRVPLVIEEPGCSVFVASSSSVSCSSPET